MHRNDLEQHSSAPLVSKPILGKFEGFDGLLYGWMDRELALLRSISALCASACKSSSLKAISLSSLRSALAFASSTFTWSPFPPSRRCCPPRRGLARPLALSHPRSFACLACLSSLSLAAASRTSVGVSDLLAMLPGRLRTFFSPPPPSSPPPLRRGIWPRPMAGSLGGPPSLSTRMASCMAAAFFRRISWLRDVVQGSGSSLIARRPEDVARREGRMRCDMSVMHSLASQEATTGSGQRSNARIGLGFGKRGQRSFDGKGMEMTLCDRREVRGIR